MCLLGKRRNFDIPVNVEPSSASVIFTCKISVSFPGCFWPSKQNPNWNRIYWWTLIFKVWHPLQALASVLNFRDGLDRKMPERKAVASFAAPWWIHPPCYRCRHPPLGLNPSSLTFHLKLKARHSGILQISSLRLRLVRRPVSLTNEMVATDRPTISAKPSFSSDYMLSLGPVSI